MKYLGPLSSLNNASRIFYVDMSNQLGVDESLSDATVTSGDSDVLIDSSGLITEEITTKDGNTLEIGKTVYFRALCNANKTAVIPVTINYSTDASDSDSTIVYLKVVPSII